MKRGPRNALSAAPASRNEPRGNVCSVLAGPETRSNTVPSLKCCPCQQKRDARLPSAAPGGIKGGGPRNALGHRPEPQVLPLPAETRREAPECHPAASRRAGAPKRARAPSRASSAAPASRNEPRGNVCSVLTASRGGPETRSGTVQSLKCCKCQQKRDARLPSAAPGGIKGRGPETRSGTVRSPETRREAPECRARRHQGGGGPETRSGTVQSLKRCPCQQKRAARQCVSVLAASRGGRHQGRGGGAPKRARAPSRASSAAPASRNEPRGVCVFSVSIV